MAVREKGPKRAFFVPTQKHSMTRIDKNELKTPTEVGKITQQKRHLLQDALKNGGPDRTRTYNLSRVRRTL